MKKLIGALVLTASFAVPSANAVFVGTITAGVPFQVTVDAATANSGLTATMVTAVKRGKLVVLGTLLTPTAGSSQTMLTAPRNVERIIIGMDVPTSGTSIVRLDQGTTHFDDFITVSGACCGNSTPAHGEWVFSVVAP